MKAVLLWLVLGLSAAALALDPAAAAAQAADDSGADGDGDGGDDGDGEGGSGVYSGGGTVSQLEVWCTTSADPYYCLPYFELFCRTHGFALACSMAQMGQNCRPGGDPGWCDYFRQILSANRDCYVNFHRPACDWLARQRL